SRRGRAARRTSRPPRPLPAASRMPAIKHRTLGLLSGLAAALALLPASAHGASSCIQVATGLPTRASQCPQWSASPVPQASLQTSTTTQTAASEAEAKQDVSNAGLLENRSEERR